MALSVTKTPPPYVAPKRPLRRMELLIMDALAFYEKTPGGATGLMIADYIRPRVGWFGRTFGVIGVVYPVLYAMVERGWLEDERLDRGTQGVRFAYRVKRHPPAFDQWTETDHDLVQ